MRPLSGSGSLRASMRPGRLGRPDLALELLLTDDRAKARELAGTLEDLNRERQGVEERILREAVATVESWPAETKARRGYVLWNEGWHEGVIGIVASRLVERFHRPVVLIARSGDGWKGSGRSISDFDLHGGLAACAEHLERFGGHRAAAGLTIDPTSSSTASQQRSGATPTQTLADVDLRPLTTVDAIVPAGALTLDLAQELDRLAPFGLGNPEPTLLVASIEATGASTVGEGKHLRFRVRQQGRDGGSAIAFGQGSQLDRLQPPGRFDVAFRLKENRWNGTVAPQLVVRRVFDAPAAYDELREWLAGQWRSGEERGRRRRAASSTSSASSRGASAAARVRELPCAPRRRRRRAAAAAGCVVGRARSLTGRAPRASSYASAWWCASTNQRCLSIAREISVNRSEVSMSPSSESAVSIALAHRGAVGGQPVGDDVDRVRARTSASSGYSSSVVASAAMRTVRSRAHRARSPARRSRRRSRARSRRRCRRAGAAG